MKKIIYTRPDGGISIVIPASKKSIERSVGKLTKEAYKKLIIDKSIPPGATDVQEIDDSEIPTDRYFRDAWKNNSNSIKVSMSKAKDIHMDNIRLKRDKELKRLDIETLKGIDVQAEKQLLRNIPQNFDLSGATTPEELKILMPEELK